MISESNIILSDNYDKILQENNELKQKIKILEHKEITITQIYTDIINKNVDINDLKKENYELKILISKLEDKNKLQDIEITKLKAENKLQDIKITELKQEIIELKTENKELKQDVKILTNTVQNLIDTNYIKKIILVCQDLNSKELLEKIFKIPVNKLMSHLRLNRNDDCHLILNSDDDITLCKEKIFYNHLINLTSSQRTLLNKKIGSELVDEIINYLGSKSYDSILSIIDNYEEEINDWFI